MAKSLLKISDLNTEELQNLIAEAIAIKKTYTRDHQGQELRGKVIGLYMALPSTRTRLSFQVAGAKMGGHLIDIDHKNTQIQRGEPVEDFAQVCSQMFSAMIIRAFDHSFIEQFAQYADIPVINALSSEAHPCQILADLMTIQEKFGSLSQPKIVWLGDYCNVCRSWIKAAKILNIKLRVALPAVCKPSQPLPAPIELFIDDPHAAVAQADVLMTDVWSSMGKEKSEEDKKSFTPFQINRQLLKLASPEAKVMHCMPIHRGEEITAEIVSDPASLIYHQASNRLYSQMALLRYLLLS